MRAVKGRNWTPEQNQMLVEIVQKQLLREKLTWKEIAEQMNQKNPNFNKTGKQCYERWNNQLDPKLQHNTEWTKDQNQLLFTLHEQWGNRWAHIALSLPGRTDNSIKNHFYCTIRKGLRKINNYIENVKRKTCLVKTFKMEIIKKILNLSEGRNDNKYFFKQGAKELAISVKRELVRVALSEQESQECKEGLYAKISEFARNCRKKKTRKSTLSSSSKDEEEEQPKSNTKLTKLEQVEASRGWLEAGRSEEACRGWLEAGSRGWPEAGSRGWLEAGKSEKTKPVLTIPRKDSQPSVFAVNSQPLSDPHIRSDSDSYKKVQVKIIGEHCESQPKFFNPSITISPFFHMGFQGKLLEKNLTDEPEKTQLLLLSKNSLNSENNWSSLLQSTEHANSVCSFKTGQKGFISSIPDVSGGSAGIPEMFSGFPEYPNGYGSGFSIFGGDDRPTSPSPLPQRKKDL